MDIGYYSDKGIPPNNNAEGIKVNSLGYRFQRLLHYPQEKRMLLYLDVRIPSELVMQKTHIGFPI